VRKQQQALSDRTDEQLMRAFQAGESVAFQTLYHRYSKRVLYYFFRMLGNSEEKAQDFLQELFMKIVENPTRFDPSRKFSTWLFSVAHNMCKNEYRKQEVRKVMVPGQDLDGHSDSPTTQDQQADLNAFRTLLYRELNELDEEKKTAFLLRHREGFSVKEISQVLGCAEGTVKSRVFYANKFLALKLKDYKVILGEG